MPAKSSRATPTSGSDTAPEPLGAVTAHALLSRYEVVSIAALKTHPKNYQTHALDQREHLEASLTLHDQYKNVVTANDLTILAGHGLVEAARGVGKTQIVIVRMPYAPDDDRAIQLMSGDNEIARLAHKNDRELATLLEGLQARGGGEALLGTGLDTLMLSSLLYAPVPGKRPGVPGGDGPSPSPGLEEDDEETDHVIQLVLSETAYTAFEAALHTLAAHYGTETVSETVVECVHRAAQAAGEGEEG